MNTGPEGDCLHVIGPSSEKRYAISKLTAQSAGNPCEYRTLAEKSEFGSHKYSVVPNRILFNWRLSTVEQNEYFCYPFVYPQVIQLNETNIDTYGGPINDYWRAQYSRIKFILPTNIMIREIF